MKPRAILSVAHAALGRHPDAIAEFQALLAWSPADVPAMLQLGLAEKARGHLDTATDWLARACAADPASAVARFYHGEVLYNRGLNEPALEALRQAIEQNPDELQHAPRMAWHGPGVAVHAVPAPRKLPLHPRAVVSVHPALPAQHAPR